jgi:hypothetical protein
MYNLPTYCYLQFVYLLPTYLFTSTYLNNSQPTYTEPNIYLPT